MLTGEPFRRFLGMGGGPSEGSRGSSVAGGPSSSSSVPCDPRCAAAARASILALPRAAALAASCLAVALLGTPRGAPAAILETLTPPPMLLGRGDEVVVVVMGRLARALAAGLEERFALGREVVRALAALLGRLGAEARFFIFLVPLDLDLLLEGFPGIKSSWFETRPTAIRGGIINAYGVAIKSGSEGGEDVVCEEEGISTSAERPRKSIHPWSGERPDCRT